MIGDCGEFVKPPPRLFCKLRVQVKRFKEMLVVSMFGIIQGLITLVLLSLIHI